MFYREGELMEKIEIIGCDSLNTTSLRRLIEIMNPEVELLDYQKQVLDMAKKYRDTYETMKSLELLVETISDLPSIEGIKKRIKYSRNPLEIKQLNRQLNMMYKERRKNG